ncbi:hypothetical protein BDL97_02G200300 [Sphagnum fallax]|nr:hypothetical protein BDL97_02G200300 [Sphagnum fallax]KAH8972499.1 hypothetical protein BDL97_02G200300 [Sphagnum fallax]
MLASKILPYMNTTCSRPVSDDEFLFAKKSRCKFLQSRQSIHTCFCGTLPLSGGCVVFLKPPLLH